MQADASASKKVSVRHETSSSSSLSPLPLLTALRRAILISPEMNSITLENTKQQ